MMEFSPFSSGRRFSLPTFDIFGQPRFPTDLYYSQFHQLHQDYKYHLPVHHNLPDTITEEQLQPQPHLHQLHQLQLHPSDPTPLIYSPSQSTYPSREIIPASPFNKPCLFAESIPSFDVSRAETPGEPYFDPIIRDHQDSEMVVQTIPASELPNFGLDGTGRLRRDQPVPVAVPKLSYKKREPKGSVATPNQAVVKPQTETQVKVAASGSTQSQTSAQVPAKVPAPVEVQVKPQSKSQPQTKPLIVNGNTSKSVPPKASPKHPPMQPIKREAQTSKPLLEKQVPEITATGPAKPGPNLTETVLAISAPLVESGSVRVYLAHLPHDNKLNSIRLRANHTTTANKTKLIANARALINDALQSCEATKAVQIGSFFSWTEKGIRFNFQTQEQRWLATENHEWLSKLGEGLRLGEKWGGIVISNIWNPYIIENLAIDENLPAKLRRLEELNPMRFNNQNGEVVTEEYRIRRIRWFGPGTLAIWFHDRSVVDYFLERGVWLMEGYLGYVHRRHVGVVGLSSIDALIEQPRFKNGGRGFHGTRMPVNAVPHGIETEKPARSAEKGAIKGKRPENMRQERR